jgi:DNA-directed RNA polymerase specialized sigma24 family protein
VFQLGSPQEERKMRTIYLCQDDGQDGRDRSIIGYCSDQELAKKVALGRGMMGHGNGPIQEVQVWESMDDIPPEVKGQIAKEEGDIKKEIEEQTAKLAKLLQDLPAEEREVVLAKLK